jgi:PAS domain S-box-containing protein
LSAINVDNTSSGDHLARLEPIIFLSTFKNFVDSPYFSQWLATNRASVSNISCERSIADSADSGDTLASVFRQEDQSHSYSGNVTENSVVDASAVNCHLSPYRSGSTTTSISRTSVASTRDDLLSNGYGYAGTAIAYLEQTDFNRIVRSQSWLSSLLTAAESLPLPFSITTASRTRFGFPLIYVNPRFESLTGYRRDEIIGRNCSFLQTCNNCVYSEDFLATVLETNERKLSVLRDVLKLGCPSTLELTNYRKDGSHFRNYLLLKPVYDQHKQYRYVIGLQFEVTSTEQKLSNRNLFDLLPDQMFIDDEDDCEEHDKFITVESK